MTAGTLPRRLLVGACSAALLAGAVGAVPLLGTASAAGCPGWTDEKGDAAWHDPIAGEADPTDPPVSYDAQLDITGSTFGTVGDSLVGTITSDGLSDTSSDTGDEFGFEFTVAGVELTLYSDRTVTPGGEVFADAGVLGPNVTGAATATYDVASKTVTIKATLAEVAKAAEKAVAGQTASAISSYTTDQVPVVPLGVGQPLIEYDRSATTITSVLGTDCGGGSTPAGTASPVGSASPTASPTATATTSPTASPTPTSTAPTMTNGPFDQPRKGCVQYKDPTGDADPTQTGLDNEDALDVTQVNLKSPSGVLQVFVGLVDPSAALLDIWSGPVYTVSFTVGGKAVTVTASETGSATATVAGKDNSTIKPTAKVDAKAKNIVFTVPLQGLSSAVGTTVKRGTPITGTAVETDADSMFGPQTADTAAGTTAAEKSYAYGDNRCFLPPPGKIVIDADPRGQFGDRTLVFATLNDADGSPVSGVRLTGALSGGRAVSAKTDNDGIADLLLPLTMPAGVRTLTVSYAGDLEVGVTRAAKAFTVVPEKTLLRLAALRGGVQATVVDDDRPNHPVVAWYVRFTIGSKSYLRKTNSRGIAVLTGVPKGTAVKVAFLAVRGYYLGTPTYTVRAR